MRLGVSVVLVVMTFVVIGDQADINSGEEREDCGLNQADEQLHEVEHKHEAGAVEEILAAEDIAEEADGKCEGADADREEFNETDHEEHQREDGIEPAGGFVLVGFVAEKVPEDDLRTGIFKNDDEPPAERNERERNSAVEVRREGTDKRIGHVEMTLGVRMAHANRADAREQTGPVLNQNKDKERDEQRKRRGKSLFPNDGFEQIAQAFEDGFKNRLTLGGQHGGLANQRDDYERDDERNEPASRHTIGDGPAIAEIDQLARRRGYTGKRTHARAQKQGENSKITDS